MTFSTRIIFIVVNFVIATASLVNGQNVKGCGEGWWIKHTDLEDFLKSFTLGEEMAKTNESKSMYFCVAKKGANWVPGKLYKFGGSENQFQCSFVDPATNQEMLRNSNEPNPFEFIYFPSDSITWLAVQGKDIPNDAYKIRNGKFHICRASHEGGKELGWFTIEEGRCTFSHSGTFMKKDTYEAFRIKVPVRGASYQNWRNQTNCNNAQGQGESSSGNSKSLGKSISNNAVSSNISSDKATTSIPNITAKHPQDNPKLSNQTTPRPDKIYGVSQSQIGITTSINLGRGIGKQNTPSINNVDGTTTILAAITETSGYGTVTVTTMPSTQNFGRAIAAEEVNPSINGTSEITTSSSLTSVVSETTEPNSLTSVVEKFGRGIDSEGIPSSDNGNGNGTDISVESGQTTPASQTSNHKISGSSDKLKAKKGRKTDADGNDDSGSSSEEGDENSTTTEISEDDPDEKSSSVSNGFVQTTTELVEKVISKSSTEKLSDSVTVTSHDNSEETTTETHKSSEESESSEESDDKGIEIPLQMDTDTDNDNDDDDYGDSDESEIATISDLASGISQGFCSSSDDKSKGCGGSVMATSMTKDLLEDFINTMACWLPQSQFKSFHIYPHGREGRQPTYAVSEDCDKNKKCEGVERINYPKTGDNRKVLYFPHGLLTWYSNMYIIPTYSTPLIIGTNKMGQNVNLCRFLHGANVILGTLSEGEGKCNMTGSSVHSSDSFETLFINSFGKASGVKANIKTCPQLAKDNGIDQNSNEVQELDNSTDTCEVNACWRLVKPNEDIKTGWHIWSRDNNKGLDDSHFLARVSLPDNIHTFGKYIPSKKKLVLLGCHSKVDKLSVQILYQFRNNGNNQNWKWMSFNRKQFSEMPKNVIKLVKSKGSPYGIRRTTTYPTVCKAELLDGRTELEPVLGIVNAETGMCSAVYRNEKQLVHFSNYKVLVNRNNKTEAVNNNCDEKRKCEMDAEDALESETCQKLNTMYELSQFKQFKVTQECVVDINKITYLQ